MAKAKKLPSGQWRTQVFSHEEIVDGKKKKIRVSFTADTKAESELLARQFLLNRDTMRSTNITVDEAMNRYIEAKTNVLSPATIKGYLSMKNNHFERIKPVQVHKLTSEMVQRAIAEESVKTSPKTVANLVGLLTASISMFAPDKSIKVTLPQKVKRDFYIPTDKDIKTLLTQIKGTDLEKAVLLAAFGSLRRSEISPLTDKDLDFKRNTVTVSKAMVQDKDHKWHIKQPKTAAGYRTVELPQFVMEYFKGIKGPLVAANPQNITNQFINAVKRSGLQRFRFHDLRHYQASILHALNVPDKYIMKRGGWASNSVMKNVYQHTISDKEEAYTALLVDYFEKMAQTPEN